MIWKIYQTEVHADSTACHLVCSTDQGSASELVASFLDLNGVSKLNKFIPNKTRIHNMRIYEKGRTQCSSLCEYSSMIE